MLAYKSELINNSKQTRHACNWPHDFSFEEGEKKYRQSCQLSSYLQRHEKCVKSIFTICCLYILCTSKYACRHTLIIINGNKYSGLFCTLTNENIARHNCGELEFENLPTSNIYLMAECLMTTSGVIKYTTI